VTDNLMAIDVHSGTILWQLTPRYVALRPDRHWLAMA
jgi:hypothetical protein